MKLEDLSDSKIAVLGLGVEGLSTAKFLNKNRVSFSILEKKELGSFPVEVQEFISLNRIPFFCGPSHKDRLEDFTIIFRNPGIPLWDTKIQEAVKRGLLVSSQTKLFFDLCPCKIIGVTGTKGKGTTSTLIYEMLKSSGFDAHIGGNIGNPPLDFLDDLTDDSVVVLELSSFQLEDLRKSPHIGVVLMTTSEHLSSQSSDSPNFHTSLESYICSKHNIVRFQDVSDVAVINYDYTNSRDFSKVTKGSVHFFSTQQKVEDGMYLDNGWIVSNMGGSTKKILKVEEVFLRGSHNLQNVLASSAASILAGAKTEKIANAIKTFKGLEHRLEFVREANGVKYYNDSFSTTPETAIAAIKSFSEPLIIILGGSDKGSDYTELGKEIVKSNNVKAVLLIGNMASRIEEAINRAYVFAGNDISRALAIKENLSSMAEIVQKCAEISTDSDIVVLSPACASFDMFKNYKDRGWQFKEYVNRL